MPVLMTVDPAIMLMVKLDPYLSVLVATMFFKLNEISELAATVLVTNIAMVTESTSAVHFAALFP